jgi:hypothetical protein
MQPRWFIGLCVALAFGCSGKYKVSQVSGRVTLNGKPLARGSVTFVPMGSKENQAPGPTAWGPIDADGRYKLAIDPKTPGTVVGKCRVYISGVLPDEKAVNDDSDTGGKRRLPRDPVPPRYNKNTDLVYDVPPGGTDKADFDLKSP